MREQLIKALLAHAQGDIQKHLAKHSKNMFTDVNSFLQFVYSLFTVCLQFFTVVLLLFYMFLKVFYSFFEVFYSWIFLSFCEGKRGHNEGNQAQLVHSPQNACLNFLFKAAYFFFFLSRVWGRAIFHFWLGPQGVRRFFSIFVESRNLQKSA